MTTLSIAFIRTDGGTQPRASLDDETVSEYADAMRNGATFPPVDVFYDGKMYWLADGYHRIAAAQRLNRTQIAANVHQGTQRDAVLHSAGANAAHGLRRTNADKRRAVLRLLQDDEWQKWSDREIARRCKVHHQMVGNLRSSLDESSSERTYTTRHGTVATMNTANIGSNRPPSPSAGDGPGERATPPTDNNRLSPEPTQPIEGNSLNLTLLVGRLQEHLARKARIPDDQHVRYLQELPAESLPQILSDGYMVKVTDVEQCEEARRTLLAYPMYQQPEQADRHAIHYSSKSAEHYTPDNVIRLVRMVLGNIDLDPCSNSHDAPNIPARTHYTQEDNGLNQFWTGTVYMNPPYGQGIRDWVEKLAEAYLTRDVTEAIALVPARTDTRWWEVLEIFPVCLVRGRLTFKGNDNGAQFPSAVFYLGPNVERFSDIFSALGPTWKRTYV